MFYKNLKVLDIEPVIYLGSKSKNWKDNQLYVKKELEKVKDKIKGSWGIECPINDMVLIYLPYQNSYDKDTNEVNVDVNYLIDAYYILREVFDNVKINFYLDGSIDNVGNNFDMDIDEFKQYLQNQKANQENIN